MEFLGRLGDDAFAGQLRCHLAANGVGTALAVDAPQPTSLAVVSLDEAGKASYTFHFAGTANFGWRADELPELGADDWLHVASLVTVVGPGHTALLDWVRAGSGPLSLDVNVRPTVLPDLAAYWALVEPWLVAVGQRGGLVKGSDEDFELLAGAVRPAHRPRGTGGGAEGALRRDVGRGHPGPDGAVAAGPEGVASVPSPPVALVDTIGAGDTFMAGMLDALVVAGLPLADALRRGAAAAALVCEREGADPPTRAELDAALG